MKRFLSLLLAVSIVVSLATFVSVADDSGFIPGDPVTLPNLSKDTVPNEGF